MTFKESFIKSNRFATKTQGTSWRLGYYCLLQRGRQYLTGRRYRLSQLQAGSFANFPLWCTGAWDGAGPSAGCSQSSLNWLLLMRTQVLCHSDHYICMISNGLEVRLFFFTTLGDSVGDSVRRLFGACGAGAWWVDLSMTQIQQNSSLLSFLMFFGRLSPSRYSLGF